MKEQPFVIERTFDVTPERLWQALTNPDEIHEWYFNLPGFRAEQGYTFSFDGGDKNKTYRHLCRVVEAEAPKKLSYTWSYEGYEGETLVTFELEPKEKGTLLRLTHEGLHRLPALPDFARERYAEGWLHIIGSSLKRYADIIANE